MDITNIDGANGNEAPGSLNEKNLIQEMTEAMIEVDSGPLDSALFKIHWDEFAPGYAKSCVAVLNVLRKRGLLTSQALELLQRDGDLTPLL